MKSQFFQKKKRFIPFQQKQYSIIKNSELDKNEQNILISVLNTLTKNKSEKYDLY